MLPPVIIAIGFLLFWGALGYVGRIENTIIAHGLLFATLPLVTISVGLNAIDRSLLDAAKTMGAEDKTVFRTVILPLIVPYVVSGYCFALVLSLNEYIVAYMVAGYAVETLPVKMLNSLRGGYTPAMSVGSVLFMLAGLVIFSVIAIFGNLPRLLGALSSKR
jgi:putative spermidine/putrescine transport system permease protein